MDYVPERIAVFKLTDDDWYPSYKLDGYHRGVQSPALVEVIFLQFVDQSGWRCCVWGADDEGRDFDDTDRDKVWDTFHFLISQPKVNKGLLHDLGFVRA